jgi:hypothetical protein
MTANRLDHDVKPSSIGASVRKVFTSQDARESGISESALRWGVRAGKWVHVERDAYLEGNAPPTDLERAVALVRVSNGTACGSLAGTLHELDSVQLRPPFAAVPSPKGNNRKGVCRRDYAIEDVVEVKGVPCANGLHTVVDLAARTDDLVWEQVLESALRKELTSIDALEAALPELGRARTPGVARMRRVLGIRPDGAPPTESLLETLMVQLIRQHTDLPTPERQVEVFNRWRLFVARVDLAWPDHGIFLELDGQHHKDQPVYDANRETAVVAAKGWLPGRFTWYEVTRTPKSVARRLTDVFEHRFRADLAS